MKDLKSALDDNHKAGETIKVKIIKPVVDDSPKAIPKDKNEITIETHKEIPKTEIPKQIPDIKTIKTLDKPIAGQTKQDLEVPPELKQKNIKFLIKEDSFCVRPLQSLKEPLTKSTQATTNKLLKDTCTEYSNIDKRYFNCIFGTNLELLRFPKTTIYPKSKCPNLLHSEILSNISLNEGEFGNSLFILRNPENGKVMQVEKEEDGFTIVLKETPIGLDLDSLENGILLKHLGGNLIWEILQNKDGSVSFFLASGSDIIQYFSDQNIQCKSHLYR